MRIGMAVCGWVVCGAMAAVGQAADPCATLPESCATLIATHATAETRIANTAVDVTVGVSTSGAALADVQRVLATQSNMLLAYLRGQKVERLITTSVNFSPDTRTQKNGPDKTVGYDGTEQVSFRTTPEKAADILAGVLTNGANEIQSTTFTPTEEEVAAARSKLAEEATKTAVGQAEAIARAAGERVVAVRSIDVENATFAPRPRMMAFAAMDKMAAAAPPPMPVAAGEQELSVSVSVTAAAKR
jgi:uncharacterized protein YggE